MDKNDRRSLLSFTADSTLCSFISRVHLCVAVLVSGCCRWQSHLLSPGISLNFCLIGLFIFSEGFFDSWWLDALALWLFLCTFFLLVRSHDTVTLIFRVVHGALYNWRHYAAQCLWDVNRHTVTREGQIQVPGRQEALLFGGLVMK